ncbi:hypothetical protein AOXY_G17755 [Acipenser oxyrinchus oxyrinchus]|uniref:Uncharacterized protein n=1 Tax=Acipenser oxyrinchus oxyrinchus TaxID=40147 RepID=A0AAD8D605_ACIOX|nr:hypothetical protein AOXY_G17755 [Acipenser oxyrinchus oxyrinchus]
MGFLSCEATDKCIAVTVCLIFSDDLVSVFRASMPAERDPAEVMVPVGQGSKVDTVRTAKGQEMTRIRDLPHYLRFSDKPKPVNYRGSRPMHQSTLKLWGPPSQTDYTTTQQHYFSGRRWGGCQLPTVPRQALCASQHHSDHHLGTPNAGPPNAWPVESHSREAFGPKEVTPHNVLHSATVKNSHYNQTGSSVREVINPTGTQEKYCTTYWGVHCSRPTRPGSSTTTGCPTPWHNYNIITGEDQPIAPKRKYKRQSGDRVLWQARRWETDCHSLRLY